MPEKDRQRQRQRNRLAPNGRLANWMLVVVAAALSVLAAVVSQHLR
jgi:4-hydroxybenzoate polyprenyltransferase